MNVNEIPGEMLARIRSQFESDPTVQRLRIMQRTKKDNLDYMGALEIAKSIEALYTKVVYNYMEEAESQVDRISIDSLPMSKEDRDAVDAIGVALFMAVDIIDGAIIDINDIIHRYDKTLNFEMFDDFRQVSKMAKDKMGMFAKFTTFLNDTSWGERCNDMYDMMLSKARALIRKKNSDPNWGRNTERLING